MGWSDRIRRRKEWLFERYPFCPKCGVAMVLNEKGQTLNKPNLATLEHLNTRFNPEERQKKVTLDEDILARYYRVGRTILLCKRCNNTTAEKEIPITELWKRSGQRPHGIRGFLKYVYFHVHDLLIFEVGTRLLLGIVIGSIITIIIKAVIDL